MLLAAIKRVTQVNRGKKTPGIDGLTALTPKERWKLFKQMEGMNIEIHNPRPSYRTYIKKKNGKRWIFEGDFKGCFDNLSHEFILNRIEDFPYKDLIRKWLKAGYVDNNVFNETESGTGQGNIVCLRF